MISTGYSPVFNVGRWSYGACSKESASRPQSYSAVGIRLPILLPSTLLSSTILMGPAPAGLGCLAGYLARLHTSNRSRFPSSHRVERQPRGTSARREARRNVGHQQSGSCFSHAHRHTLPPLPYLCIARCHHEPKSLLPLSSTLTRSGDHLHITPLACSITSLRLCSRRMLCASKSAYRPLGRQLMSSDVSRRRRSTPSDINLHLLSKKNEQE